MSYFSLPADVAAGTPHCESLHSQVRHATIGRIPDIASNSSLSCRRTAKIAVIPGPVFFGTFAIFAKFAEFGYLRHCMQSQLGGPTQEPCRGTLSMPSG
jgi:hypothetical protein